MSRRVKNSPDYLSESNQDMKDYSSSNEMYDPSSAGSSFEKGGEPTPDEDVFTYDYTSLGNENSIYIGYSFLIFIISFLTFLVLKLTNVIKSDNNDVMISSLVLGLVAIVIYLLIFLMDKYSIGSVTLYAFLIAFAIFGIYYLIIYIFRLSNLYHTDSVNDIVLNIIFSVLQGILYYFTFSSNRSFDFENMYVEDMEAVAL